jgi:hypothetical protein
MPEEKSIWMRQHPNPPTNGPSDYYWFKHDMEQYESVMEVWINRKYWPKGWWGPKISPIRKRAPKCQS